jgi:hypothetical protein
MSLLFSAEVEPPGCLGRSPDSEVAGFNLQAASPSPAGGRVVFRSDALIYSGGTAPDFHRTSLLCPLVGHPEQCSLIAWRPKCNQIAQRIP